MNCVKKRFSLHDTIGARSRGAKSRNGSRRGLRSSGIEKLESRRLLSGYAVVTLAAFNSTNGAYPYDTLVLSGNTLYGTTKNGGAYGFGTVFSVPVAGGSPTTLGSFSNTSNGAYPYGGLVLSGTTLYGTTYQGGADNVGTVFSLPITGGVPRTLAALNFTNENYYPYAGLTLSGSTLYGTTNSGGVGGGGTVFSVPVAGGSVKTLASFNGSNGSYLEAGVTVSGTTLYGTTESGGANNSGTVFSVPTAGGTPHTLATFNKTNGANPYAAPVLSGSTLYGTTVYGGASGVGTVYSVPVTGGSPTTLVTFNYTNGSLPYGPLALSGSTLYGTTAGGGANSQGTVFSLPVTGGSLSTLASFNSIDGAGPNGGIIFSGSNLYGTTESGYGTESEYGTVFEMTPATPQLVFAEQPANAPGGVPMGDVSVDVTDGNGHIETSDESSVTLAIGGTGVGQLNGTLTVQARNGVATFSGLSSGNVGTFTLLATDGSDTPATSAAFSVGTVELYYGGFVNGVSTGAVEFGLTPLPGSSFVPLLYETGGTVSYDQNKIYASGNFAAVQLSEIALFHGTFTIALGDAATSSFSATADLTIAGLPTTFSDLTFQTGAGGTTNDSHLALAGGLTLPSSLGGFQITLSDTDPFVVGTGLGISTGTVPVPNTTFELENAFEISATDMSFDFSIGYNELKIQGDFIATLKNGSAALSLELNLSGANYIDYEPANSPALKVVGTLTYSNPTPTSIFNGWLSIVNAQFAFDNVTGGNTTVAGSITLQTSRGQFTGQVAFLNGYLDSFGLTGAQLAIPLEPPGLFLQTVGGSVTGLAPDDLNDTEITGTLEFSYGGLVDATLVGSVQLNADNSVNEIEGSVAVNIADGTATGQANLEDNLVDGTFGLTSLSIQAFNNTLSFDGSLTGSSDGVLSGMVTGTFTLPKFVGGGSVSGSLAVYLSPSSDESQSYITASAVAGSFGTVKVRYGFDKSVTFSLNGLTLNGSTGAWTSLLDLADNAVDVVSGSLAMITNQLAEGYANGTWSATGGIVSSTAAAGETPPTNSGTPAPPGGPKFLTTLGVLQNNEAGAPIYNSTNTFDGTVPGATDVLIKYTYYGDANLDGKVDGSDYARVDNGYLTHLTGWLNGDFNYDSVINGSDYALIDNIFNTQGEVLPSALTAAQFSLIANKPSPKAPVVVPNAPVSISIHLFAASPPVSLRDASLGDLLDRLQVRGYRK